MGLIKVVAAAQTAPPRSLICCRLRQEHVYAQKQEAEFCQAADNLITKLGFFCFFLRAETKYTL